VTRSHKPRISSNASIFADRGDPWVSDREGREKFGRNLSSENPPLDAYLFGGRPKKLDLPVVTKAKPEPEKEIDVRRLLTNKLLSGKRKVARPKEEAVSRDEVMAKLKGLKK
jgi:hypothetical protein